MQGYRKFVEPGRVAYVNYGRDYGKLCVIADVADQNTVLVDGPAFPRVTYPVRRLALTNLRMKLNRGARTSTLLKAAKEFDLDKKWAATPEAKRLAQRETRSKLNDFERFQVMINRKRRAHAIRKLTKKVIKK